MKVVVYAASGCTLAPPTFDRAEATAEDGPVPLELDSPYQISKVGEFYSVYYHTQHCLPTVRARFQNVYGPGEILGAGQWRGTPATVWRNVTPTFVYRALKQLPLTVDNGGMATRDFIYVEDIVRGLVLCAVAGKPGDGYSLASGVETSILELANLVNELTGNPAPLDFRPPREWDRSGKLRQHREGQAGARVRDPDRAARGPRRDHRLDPRLPLIDRCIEKHAARIQRLCHPSSLAPLACRLRARPPKLNRNAWLTSPMRPEIARHAD